MFPNRSGNKGVSVVEILVAIFILSLVLGGLLEFASFSLQTSNLLNQANQANNLAQEAMEAVRNFRDGTNWTENGLGTLTTGLAYYPQKSTDTSSKWLFVQGEETIDGFTRKVVFERVSRDPSTKNIEEDYNPSNDDPDTRKVIVTVSWQERGRGHKIELVNYFTNWK